jgi:polyisoprenyl-phosphate glycosyltransferase
MKTISIVTACYNEEDNVEKLYLAVKGIMNGYSGYEYEHIFIDNYSRDKTVPILKKIAAIDSKVKIIVNERNFGHIRSPFHAILQAKGDAVISIVADFQDPPELIKTFIAKWEEGNKIVIGIKNKSEENPLMFLIRKMYYNVIERISSVEHIKNFTGFGLYDRKFIDVLKKLNEPYPYFRGLVAELGFSRCEVMYLQTKRTSGKSKNNFYTLYDIAMLGFINCSKVPLRVSIFIGVSIGLISLLVAVGYLIYKLLYWETFNAGIAPLVIGLFFFSSVQLFFIGILGEYIGAIYTQVKNHPHVIEKERINFPDDKSQ